MTANSDLYPRPWRVVFETINSAAGIEINIFVPPSIVDADGRIVVARVEKVAAEIIVNAVNTFTSSR